MFYLVSDEHLVLHQWCSTRVPYNPRIPPAQSRVLQVYNLDLGSSKPSSSKCTGISRVSGILHWGSAPPERLETTVPHSLKCCFIRTSLSHLNFIFTFTMIGSRWVDYNFTIFRMPSTSISPTFSSLVPAKLLQKWQTLHATIGLYGVSPTHSI